MIWAFFLVLCCPYGAEHSVTFEVRTRPACESMRKLVASQVDSFTLRATVSQCVEVVPKP